MPLSVAAVCPHPPLLVPQLAAGAAGELDDLRAACDAAVARLLAARPRHLVILGSVDSATGRHEYDYPFHGSFTGFGVPVSAQVGGGAAGPPPLPLSLSVGVWLLDRATPSGWLHAEAIATDAPVVECLAHGERYARQPASVGLLVMGDGTACRGERAPGGDDPRAEEYDAMVTKALAEVETDALLRLDPRLSGELRVAGRAPWQVLAAAAAASPGPGFVGEVLYDSAPYGVNYTVAVWAPR